MRIYNMRFDPDGECRQSAIDFITTYLSDKLYPEAEIRSLSNLYKVIEFLKKRSINFIIKIPLISLFYPQRLIWFIKNRKAVSFGRKFNSQKGRLLKEGNKYAILYFSSASKLYGLTGEVWSHHIVEYSEDSEVKYFDPLFEILSSENTSIENVKEKTLWNLKSPAILLWQTDNSFIVKHLD